MPVNPSLPPELERLIFEHAARESHWVIPSLMRVDSRVKQWVEPFLYETIVFNHSPYSPPKRELSIRWNSVRHLLLRDGMTYTAAWDYLHSCRNLLTLSFYADEIAGNPRGWKYPDVFPAYRYLTHLELLTAFSPLVRISWLISLPALTHLFILSPMTNINKSVKQILAACRQLRMILWCPWTRRFRDDVGEPTNDQIQAVEFDEPEPRVVICKVGYEQFTKLFIAHAEGKSDSETVWKLAEEIINKRLLTGITCYADIVDVSPIAPL